MAFDFDNYYKLEYIESSGTQYIDTGITESNYIAVDCKLYNPSPVNDYLFGSQQNSSAMMYNGLYSGSVLEYNWNTINYTAASTIELTQSISGSTLVTTINGSVYSSNIGTSGGSAFYIFACTRNDGSLRYYGSTLRLYYFKIYNDAQFTLARSFIPAKRKSDNVIGLYDEVNGVFYINSGTGSFTGGGIIMTALIDLEKGLTVPVTPNTSTSYTLVDTPSAIGFSSASATASAIAIPVMNGRQTWSGAKNTITVLGTCSGLDDESNPLDGAVRVAGLVDDIPAGVGIAQTVVGDNVYNAVWNDLIDCVEVPEDTILEYGYAYCTDGTNFYKAKSYIDPGYIGIHSDTAGFCMGDKGTPHQLKAAVAGFVLAYVDKKYAPGTPLTTTENGYLTKLKEEDMASNPQALVGTYWKEEPYEYWGFDKGLTENLLVKVDGRKWIRIK